VKDLVDGSLIVLQQRIACVIDLLDRAQANPRIRQKCQSVRDVLDDSARNAKQARGLLAASPSLIADIVRQYNAIAQQVYLVEQLVVGPLSRFAEDDEKLSRLCERVCNELGIIDVPVVVAAASQYFSALPPYGLIVTPPTESRQLLNLPDLYHELAHHLDGRGEPLVGSRFEPALNAYVAHTEDEITRLARPVDVQQFRELIGNWFDWSLEVAADAFATLLVGPAYAWANFHLMLRVPSIFAYSDTHPADAARMDFILRLLASDGRFRSDNETLESRWKAYREFPHPNAPGLYELLHPAELFSAVLDDVRDALDRLGIKPDPLGPDTVPAILNEGWRRLLDDPNDYITWESATVAELISART
jgi:hypothetical protein